MRSNIMHRTVGRFRGLALIAAGGILYFAIPGCKTEFSNLFLDGLEAGITEIIPGFFELIMEEVNGSTGGVPTVLNTLEPVTQMFA